MDIIERSLALIDDTEVTNENWASYGVNKGQICMLILLMQPEFKAF
jgi:hypothetical protein